MKTSNIYVFTNKINGKQYVGQSENPNERYKQHKKDSKNKKHTNIIFYNAISKYGIDNFDFKIIETNIPIDKINDSEKYWIKTLNSMKPNGYNMTDGGEGTHGYKHTEESKCKMSELKKEKYKGENNPLYGKHHSEETKEKISNGNKGKVRTKEMKEKISINNAKNKKTIFVNINNNECLVFRSLRESTRWLLSYINEDIKFDTLKSRIQYAIKNNKILYGFKIYYDL